MISRIYALCEPSGKIRYIGKTVRSLTTRFSGHLYEARCGNNYRCCWIRSLLSKGFLPKIQLIGEVDGDGGKEEIAWIKYFKDEGVKLVNSTDGGDAPPSRTGKGLSDEHKQKIGLANKGKTRSAISCEKNRLAHIGKAMPVKARMKFFGNKWNKGRKHSAQSRLNMSLAHIGKKWSPLTFQRRKGRIISDITRSKLSEAGKHRVMTLDTRRKLSIALKGNKNGINPSFDARQKMSDAAKIMWQRRKSFKANNHA